VPRGTELLPDARLTVIVLEGFCRSYRIFADGRQVIFDFRIPGDVACLRNLIIGRSHQELSAATDAVVCLVPTAALRQLLDNSPPIMEAFMDRLDAEDANMADRFAHMARSSALGRTASLLLNLLQRMEPVDLVKNLTFPLAITQDDMADALGLTPVHVNRTLRQLRDGGVAHIVNGYMSILDLPALQALAA
jgi:CRP-like cAMP-binding protein